MVTNVYKNAIQSLWSGKCTVTALRHVTDEATGRSTTDEVTICENESCRISFETVTVPEISDNAGKTVQSVKLFVRTEVNIPPGSKITVTQNGITGIYEQSGVPAVYTNHKEIPLKLLEEWA